MQYTPIKVGKSGHKVHAGYKVGSIAKGRNTVETYACACTVVNTHNINSHPRIYKLAAETKITCERCVKIISDAQPGEGS